MDIKETALRQDHSERIKEHGKQLLRVPMIRESMAKHSKLTTSESEVSVTVTQRKIREVA